MRNSQEIRTADGNTLIVLANHFKSKGFGTPCVQRTLRASGCGRAHRDDLSPAPRRANDFIAGHWRFQRHAGQRSASARCSASTDEGMDTSQGMAEASRMAGRPGTFKNGNHVQPRSTTSCCHFRRCSRCWATASAASSAGAGVGAPLEGPTRSLGSRRSRGEIEEDTADRRAAIWAELSTKGGMSFRGARRASHDGATSNSRIHCASISAALDGFALGLASPE